MTGTGWDPDFKGTAAALGPQPRVITAALDKNGPTRGHICVVNPNIIYFPPPYDQNVSQISVNPDPNGNSWIATPGGIITYSTTSGGGAALAGPDHSPTTLGSIDLITPNRMDLSSLDSSPAGAAPAINGLGAETLKLPTGVSSLADLYVPDLPTDRFWEYHPGAGVPHSILQGGFQTKANPWSMDAETYFTMELAHSQMDTVITTAQVLGSI